MKKVIASLLLAVSPLAFSAQLDISRTNLKANTPGSDNTAAYMLVENLTDKDVRIVSAASDVAEFTELHSHRMDGDRMIMRQEKYIDVDAGETVRFVPNGYHIMLINLKKRMKHGEVEDITLIYDDGTSQTVPFTVIDPRKAG
ncbi:copper chaperone PCu(A)C [Marinomonas sp. IMCC 4694]|uniref:copper chaperone PCu(A)C n=1 Tax=Marinomonas sp. IMCC 4694 TaxID=2605432 RepID=UPI0011E7FA5A|nr:copper chaperone PCu(A)C [Marinomonas sp. IMCC 4694]TYL46535.1 copper chaperone PCu(A)C [Marinomonas sp. IMCC 4694]